MRTLILAAFCVLTPNLAAANGEFEFGEPAETIDPDLTSINEDTSTDRSDYRALRVAENLQNTLQNMAIEAMSEARFERIPMRQQRLRQIAQQSRALARTIDYTVVSAIRRGMPEFMIARSVSKLGFQLDRLLSEVRSMIIPNSRLIQHARRAESQYQRLSVMVRRGPFWN